MKPFNTIKAIALASALSISAVGTVALAQTEGAQDGGARAHAWHKGGRGGGHGEFFAGLNLTDAQKQQIQQIHESHRATLDPLMQEMRAKRQELRQLQDGATFDEALVRQKLTDIAIEYSGAGRIPATPRHWPGALTRLLPRALSDNLLLAGRKPHG